MRYYFHSASLDEAATAETLGYRIAARCHVIEKGLCLEPPRAGFGQPLVLSLLAQVELYLRRFGPHPVVEAAVAALGEYVSFSKSLGGDMSWMEGRLEQIKNSVALECPSMSGGTISFRPAQIAVAAEGSFKAVLTTRRSIRDFDGREVPRDVIRKATELAIFTPSACNRQAWHVHYVCGAAKAAVLARQSGNRGFGHRIPTLLVVTGDVAAFYGSGERNQIFVDCGMFTMSLLLALQSEGLVSCCLNCCYSSREESALREAITLGKSEVPVVMLGVGYPPARVRIPVSARRPLHEFLTVHGEGKGSPRPHS